MKHKEMQGIMSTLHMSSPFDSSHDHIKPVIIGDMRAFLILKMLSLDFCSNSLQQAIKPDVF